MVLFPCESIVRVWKQLDCELSRFFFVRVQMKCALPLRWLRQHRQSRYQLRGFSCCAPLSEQWRLVVPAGYERAGNAAPMQAQHGLVAKSREDRWHSGICRLLGSVRSTEFDAVGQE